MLAIKVENLSKQYRLGEVGTGTLSHDLNRWWARIRGKEDPFAKIGSTNDRTQKADNDYVWALKDVNFEINQGDAVGIIGRNGAGKSTLLKILSRTTLPTTGSVKVKGRIASLLEVGTGFHPEMTGRENIYQNGALLGMTKREITRKFDEIVDFSGCERYIDTPVKRYSSGMYVRLAFAVAAHLESEILIVDEVLAVGDAEFQKKCLGKMNDVSKGEGRTVLFVSHNMGAIRQLCERGILLNNGQLQITGNILDVVSDYQKSKEKQSSFIVEESNKSYYLKRANILGTSNDFYNDENISFSFEIGKNQAITNNKFLLVRVLDDLEQVLFSSEIELQDSKKEYSLTIPKKTVLKGSYKLNCIIYHPAITQYDNVGECCNFEVIDNVKEFSHLDGFDIGKVFIKQTWV